MPGRFAEGPRHPGPSLPASAVSEQETRKVFRETWLPLFVAAQELVAFDRGYHTDGTLIAVLGALNAAEAAHANRSRKRNLVGKRQEDFNGRAFLHVLPQVEVDPARADVAGFRAGFPNSCSGGPADGKRQPHGKALGAAAFSSRQDRTSSKLERVYPEPDQPTIGQRVQNLFQQIRYEGTRNFQFLKQLERRPIRLKMLTLKAASL
jgi:hypothetical protein